MGLTLSAVAALGCGGSSGSSGLVSCTLSASAGGDTEVLMFCQEASGAQGDSIRQQCPAGAGLTDGGVSARYQLGSGCSHVGALGACSINAGGATETIWYYHNGTLASGDVQLLCADVDASFIGP
jgi:hypothetical protein